MSLTLSSLITPAPLFFVITKASHFPWHFLCIQAASSHLWHSGGPFISPPLFLPHSLPLHLSFSFLGPVSPSGRLALIDSDVCSVVYPGDSSEWRWGGCGDGGINMLLGDGGMPSSYLLTTYTS